MRVRRSSDDQSGFFSTSTCPWCSRTKRYLKDKGVSVKELNVERDGRAARDMVNKTGKMGVPVIKTGSECG